MKPCDCCGREGLTTQQSREFGGNICSTCYRGLKAGKDPDEVAKASQSAFRGFHGRKPKAKATPKPNYPIVQHMPVWVTSDDMEFGNEIDALRHQCELYSGVVKC
jgi:hypothetical protein